MRIEVFPESGMRFLLGIVLVVGATALFCHGFFNQSQAWERYHALSSQAGAAAREGPKSREELIRTWPYTTAASQARLDILDAWVKEKPPAPREGTLKATWNNIRQGGFSSSLPFVLPTGTAVIALLGLLLSVVLPRTRMRDLAIILLILGALALWPGLSPAASQVGLVGTFGPLRQLVAWFPQIAVGVAFLGGLFVLGRRRPKATPEA